MVHSAKFSYRLFGLDPLADHFLIQSLDDRAALPSPNTLRRDFVGRRVLSPRGAGAARASSCSVEFFVACRIDIGCAPRIGCAIERDVLRRHLAWHRTSHRWTN